MLYKRQLLFDLTILLMLQMVSLWFDHHIERMLVLGYLIYIASQH